MSYAEAVELRHLRYFIAVAQHGSFNRAAQVLHLTQPALSRQVKDLEEEVAVPLLERGKNAVTLTKAGASFCEEAQEILARVELAVQRTRGGVRPELLRVGYAPSAAAKILPRALQRFHQGHPRVHVELTDLAPPAMLRMARDGELDVVITLDPPGKGIPNFQWEKLHEIRLALVMPLGHELAKLKRIPPQRLPEIPLIGLDPESFPEYLPHIRKILKPFSITPRFAALERDGVSTMFSTIEAHHAAAILAESAVDFMPRSLVSRPFFPAFAPVVARIGWSTTRAAPQARSFVAAVQKAAQLKAKD